MLVRHVARAWDEAHADARLSPKPELLDAMEIAMVFESTGRESEISYSDDPNSYTRDRKASRFNFRKYAVETAKIDDDIVNRCSNALKLMYIGGDEPPLQVAVRSVFEVAHELELLRCEDPLSLDQKFRELRPHVGTEERLRQLVELAESAIRATGDEL
eukprot:25398-Pleurochrysis_carterae.AAC.1